MPVILRLCVAIEKATPRLAPTTALLDSGPSTKSADGQSPSIVASTAVVHTEVEPLERNKTATVSGEPHNNTNDTTEKQPKGLSKIKDAASKSADKKGDTSSAVDHHNHYKLFHWFRRHDNKKKEASARPTPVQISGIASHELLTDDATGTVLPTVPGAEDSQTSTLLQRPSNHAPGSITAENAQPSLISLETIATMNMVHAAKKAGKQEAEQALEQRLQQQRSLVWVSVQLTPATTVKMVLQQVQDMVERRIGAKLCEGSDVGAFSTSTTPVGSFANASLPTQSPQSPSLQRAAQKTGKARTADSTSAASHTVQVANPTARPSADAAAAERGMSEWCLCLQDGDGIFHWVGGTRHYQKTVVLHAPFVTEACLRSNAAFEAERQQQKEERKAQRKAKKTSAVGNSQQASFATGGGASVLNSNGNKANFVTSAEAFSSDGSDSSLNSSDNGSAGQTGEAAAAAGRSGRRRLLPTYHLSHIHHNSSTSGKAARTNKKGSKAGGDVSKDRGKAGLLDSPGKRHVSAMSAKRFSKPSANEAKFAFLKGVVVSSYVLKERNLGLMRHRRKPPLYVEVHVPRGMRVEPLDPTTTTTVTITGPTGGDTNSAQEPKETTQTAAARGNEYTTDGESAAHSPMPQQGSDGSVEDVEVDVARPSAPLHHTDSSFSSSASTLTRRSPLPGSAQGTLHATQRSVRKESENGGGNEDHNGAVLDNGSRHGSWSLWADGKESTRRESAPPELPLGLATHATPVGSFCQGDAVCLVNPEQELWCRSAEAAHIKGVDVALLRQLTEVEDEARLSLATVQREYAAALMAYRAVVPPTPQSVRRRSNAGNDEGGSTPQTATATAAVDATSNATADAELAALLKRKLELQASVDDARQVERQCERLTTLVECLERELREHEERRALLMVRAN